MPEDGGLAVLRFCRTRFPGLAPSYAADTVCSGHAKPPDLRPEGAAHFLPKRFTRQQMAAALQSVGARIAAS